MTVLHVCKFSAERASRLVMQLSWDGGGVMDRGSGESPKFGALGYFNLLRAIYMRAADTFVFHMQSTLPFLLFAYIFSRIFRRRIRIVYDIHDFHEWPKISGIRPRLRWLVLWMLEWVALRISDDVITVSRGLSRLYYRKAGRRVGVVYNIPQIEFSDGEVERAGILYFGWIDSIRLPKECLSLFSVRNPIDIYGVLRQQPGEYLNHFHRLSEGGAIRVLGSYSPSDLRFVGRYSANFMMFDAAEVNIRFCLPNKLFQSLAFNTPCYVSEGLFETRMLFKKWPEYVVSVPMSASVLPAVASSSAARRLALQEYIAQLRSASRSIYLAAVS